MAGFAELRQRMVVEQIAARGVRDEQVLGAMRKVPRELFVAEKMRGLAYEDTPLPIAAGQTISQPYIVAYMAEALALHGGDKVLEIGTGSGYAAAVLAEIAAEVYTIERISELAESAAATLQEAGYENVHILNADGTRGWAEQAPFVEKGMAIDADSFWPRFAQMCLNLRKHALAAAVDDARVLAANYPRSPDALRILRDRDLAQGNVQIALARYAKAFPELSESAAPAVSDDNLFAAVDYAKVLIENNDVARANELLAQVLQRTSTRHRGGTYGFWLADVSALAIQGNKEEAIARLGAALESGYRIKLWYHLYMDPNLDSIRDDPDFLQLRNRAEALIQEQAKKYAALRDSLKLEEIWAVIMVRAKYRATIPRSVARPTGLASLCRRCAEVPRAI